MYQFDIQQKMPDKPLLKMALFLSARLRVVGLCVVLMTLLNVGLTVERDKTVQAQPLASAPISYPGSNHPCAPGPDTAPCVKETP